MTFEVFISILMISCTATSIAIEIIKKTLNKFGLEYKVMPMSVIIAFLVGAAEIIVYTANYSTFSWLSAIYTLCMGLANALASTSSYDLVKTFISELYRKVD